MRPSLTGDAAQPETELESLRRQGLFRNRTTLDSSQGPTVIMDGRQVLNFCSNDYLGLASHPALILSLQHAAEAWGVGSGASQMVCGRSTPHAELELALARATGRDRALVFSSGYLANLAVAGSYCSVRSDLILEDRLNHASLIDGARMSRAVLRRYAHADTEALARILENKDVRRKLVLTDSVFSMDGDIAPLVEIAAICREARACLLVDDAHGFGVLGPGGRGTLEHFALDQDQVPLLMFTFGKSLGVFGACIAGPEPLLELLVQRARSYIYTTALPPALCVAVRQSLEILLQESWRREHLQLLIRRFRAGAARAGLPLLESATPIQPLLVGGAGAAVALSESLLEHDILVTPIRPPTVPANSSRLRITLTAAHTESHVDYLLEALASCLEAVRLAVPIGERHG